MTISKVMKEGSSALTRSVVATVTGVNAMIFVVLGKDFKLKFAELNVSRSAVGTPD